MAWGSVSRGVHRRSIELRNHHSGVPTLLDEGEGNMNECDMRAVIRLPGVRDLWHVHTLHEREPGDLGSGCCLEGSPAGEGQGRNPGVYTSEKSDRLIVPEKPSNKAPSIPMNSGPRGCGDGGGKGPDQGEPVKVQSRRGGILCDGGLIWRTLNGHERRNPGYGQVERPTLSQNDLLSGLERVREAESTSLRHYLR